MNTGQSPKVRKTEDQVREDLAKDERDVDNATRHDPKRRRIPILIPRVARKSE